MPFSGIPHEFEPGELVYGTHEARKWYISTGVFKQQPGERPGLARTIDEYRVTREEQGKERAVSSHLEAKFLSGLMSHSKYASSWGAPEDNSSIRRKSKGGLYWATMVQKLHVHFILDGIDMAEIVGKSHIGKNPDSPQGKASGSSAQTKNRSITGSELRWVYRHRDHVNVQQYVQFWIDGRPCSPPWEGACKTFANGKYDTIDGRALWSTYSPSVVNVHHDSQKS